MNELTGKVISSNIPMAILVIDFFTSNETNKSLHQEAVSQILSRPTRNSDSLIDSFLDMDFLAISDFISFYYNKNKIGPSVDINLIQTIVKSLEEHRILVSASSIVFGVNLNEERYKGTPYSLDLHKHKLILNLVCGWKYIVNIYKKSVFKIIIKNKLGDYNIGTGFYLQLEGSLKPVTLILTNKHVVEDAAEIKVLSYENQEISYNKVISDPERDIAFIVGLQRIPAIPFYLTAPEILTEIITIGFPKIPMVKDAYQVYHKGEINSFIEDYNNDKFFLFSAKTAPGNSGSPIINQEGKVTGIISREFFEQKNEQSNIGYYAGIPCNEIIDSVNKNLLVD